MWKMWKTHNVEKLWEYPRKTLGRSLTLYLLCESLNELSDVGLGCDPSLNKVAGGFYGRVVSSVEDLSDALKRHIGDISHKIDRNVSCESDVLISLRTYKIFL